MAPITHYAINHTARSVAAFFGGQERAETPLPPGWEHIDLSAALRGKLSLKKGMRLPVQQKLEVVCPPGYAVTPWSG